MKNNWKGAICAALLSVTTFGAGAAYTAAAHAQTIPGRYAALQRGDERGDRNLLAVRQRLANLIDQLQRDPRDYGGHRETAVDLLSKARFELDAAVAYEEHSERR